MKSALKSKIQFLHKVNILLVDKFKEINVVTQESEWLHMKSFEVKEDTWEHKFYHPKLGYIDFKDINEKLVFNIDIVHFFRYSTLGDDLDLIKNLFSELMERHKNPNIGYYEDSEHNLTNAARHGNLEVIKFLVDNGVNIHVDYETNVIAALNSGKYDVVTYFLETDPKINQEVIFNNPHVTEEMINFIKKWNIYNELNAETSNSNKAEAKLKI